VGGRDDVPEPNGRATIGTRRRALEPRRHDTAAPNPNARIHVPAGSARRSITRGDRPDADLGDPLRRGRDATVHARLRARSWEKMGSSLARDGFRGRRTGPRPPAPSANASGAAIRSRMCLRGDHMGDFRPTGCAGRHADRAGCRASTRFNWFRQEGRRQPLRLARLPVRTPRASPWIRSVRRARPERRDGDGPRSEPGVRSESRARARRLCGPRGAVPSTCRLGDELPRLASTWRKFGDPPCRSKLAAQREAPARGALRAECVRE